MMLGKDRILEIVNKTVAESSADMTQAVLTVGESSLTRFAKSIIHQNVSEKDASLEVKAVVGKKIGYATTNRLDDESIKHVVEKAITFAEHSQENADFVSLPKPKAVDSIDAYDEVTANYSPEERASVVGGMIAEGKKFHASASGAFSTGYTESAVANSLGIEAYSASTLASLTTVMNADSGYGYADQMSRHVADLEPLVVAAESASRSKRSRNPEGIEPGEYTVVLLPYAVSELLEFLAWIGLGALSVQEGRSFMAGKFGQKVTGENITIWDDGLDPEGLPRSFDAEGVPRQRVELIVNGVANSVVYDSYTANKEGKESTGHATGSATYGPMPSNLFMKPGDASIAELISSTKRGILVTRFHYVNIIHPTQTLITGMTRDGTFLIENGVVAKPLKNLRFTDNIIERLSHVEAISRETKRQGIGVVPAIKAHGFRFTGATEF